MADNLNQGLKDSLNFEVHEVLVREFCFKTILFYFDFGKMEHNSALNKNNHIEL